MKFHLLHQKQSAREKFHRIKCMILTLIIKTKFLKLKLSIPLQMGILYFGFEEQNIYQHQNEACIDHLKIPHLQKRTDHIVHQY